MASCNIGGAYSTTAAVARCPCLQIPRLEEKNETDLVNLFRRLIGVRKYLVRGRLCRAETKHARNASRIVEIFIFGISVKKAD